MSSKIPMKNLRFAFSLAFALIALASFSTPAIASASLYEHYSLSSGPSVAASQITSIWGRTLHFGAGEYVVMDAGWMSANAPQVGGYLVVPLNSASALATNPSYSEADYSDGSSFESDYALETYVHGGHEPVIIVVD